MLPSSGTTPYQAMVPLELYQAVILPNVRVSGGGTASTLKSGDMTLFGLNYEAIGAYKYHTIFYMKGNKSVDKILKS